MQTRAMFPSQPVVRDTAGQWVVDTGYPYSQLCDLSLDDNRKLSVFTDVDRLCKNHSTIPCTEADETTDNCCYTGLGQVAPICQSDIMREVEDEVGGKISGVVGSDFLSRNCISVNRDSAHLCDGGYSCDGGAKVPTHDRNDQHGVQVTFKNALNGRTVTETCFLDTGGKVALTSASLWEKIGLGEGTDGGTLLHTEDNGNTKKFTMRIADNSGAHVTAYVQGRDGKALDISPTVFNRVPDKFNTLYDFPCSIGTDNLRNLNAITLDLPNNIVCMQ